MKFIDVEGQFVIVRTRTPSPDNWRQSYEVRYIFPIVSKLYDELMELDDPESYLTAAQRKAKNPPIYHFYDKFSSLDEFNKIPIEVRDKLTSIINNLQSFANFTLSINNYKIEDKKIKAEKINYLRSKGIPLKPLPTKSFDFWAKLTTEEKEHNKIVDDGKDGLPAIIRQFPAFKGVKIIPDGRLKQLKWSLSESLFTKEDLIRNPKFIRQQQGKGRANTGVRAEISISTAFINARTALATKLRKRFFPIDESVYLIDVQDAYPPNAKRKNGELYWDKDKPPVEFRWDLKTENFVGKIGKDDAFRLPDDPEAETFGEIYFSEMMPLFELIIDYMKNDDGTFKDRFQIGHDKLIGESPNKWISLFRVSPPDEQALKEIALETSKSLLNYNPKIFLHLLEPVQERHREVVILNNFPRKTQQWVENRVEWYLELIEKGYGFADVLTDKSLEEYINHYNKLITAYNLKKTGNKPLVQGFLAKPKSKSKEKINQWKKEFADQTNIIGRRLLKAKGWYYTIPNEDFNTDIDFSEDEVLRDRRLDLEKLLFELESKISEREQNAKSTRVYKRDLKYREFQRFHSNGDIETLINYYEDIILNPDHYRKPDVYKDWLKKFIPEADIKEDKDIRELAEQSAIDEEARKVEDEKTIKAIVKPIKDVKVFKKIVDRDDLKNLVVKV